MIQQKIDEGQLIKMVEQVDESWGSRQRPSRSSASARTATTRSTSTTSERSLFSRRHFFRFLYTCRPPPSPIYVYRGHTSMVFSSPLSHPFSDHPLAMRDIFERVSKLPSRKPDLEFMDLVVLPLFLSVFSPPPPLGSHFRRAFFGRKCAQ